MKIEEERREGKRKTGIELTTDDNEGNNYPKTLNQPEIVRR